MFEHPKHPSHYGLDDDGSASAVVTSTNTTVTTMTLLPLSQTSWMCKWHAHDKDMI